MRGSVRDGTAREVDRVAEPMGRSVRDSAACKVDRVTKPASNGDERRKTDICLELHCVSESGLWIMADG